MLALYGRCEPVIEYAVVGLGRAGLVPAFGYAVDERKGEQGVARNTDREGRGQHDGRGQQPGLGDPVRSGDLAKAVVAVEASEDAPLPQFAQLRHDGGHAAAHDVRAVFDQRNVANADAGHVGDGIEWPGRQGADRHAELA